MSCLPVHSHFEGRPMRMLRFLTLLVVVGLAMLPPRADAQNPISFRTPTDTVVTDSVQTFIFDLCTGFLRDTSAYLHKDYTWTPLFLSDGPSPQCGGSGHAFMVDATLSLGTSHLVVEIQDVNYTYWRDSVSVIYQLPGGGSEEPSGQPEVSAPTLGGVPMSPAEYRLMQFVVTNVSGDSAFFEGVISCTGVVVSCQSGGSSTFETPYMASGHSAHYQVNVGVSALPGSGTVRMIASGDVSDTATMTVNVARDSLPSLVVKRGAQSLTVPASSAVTTVFTVRNPDAFASRLVYLSAPCYNLTSCIPTPSTVSLAPGKDTVVRVTAVSSTSAGQIRLNATAFDGPPAGSDTTLIGIKFAYNPWSLNAAAQEPRPRSSVSRGECLSVAAGSGAGIECGGLRLAYAFPSLRTMNKERALRLIYLSQHATAHQTIPVRVAISNRTDSTGLKTTLTINSVNVIKTFAWHPSCATSSGCMLNVPLNADSLNLSTGDYAFSLQVEMADSAAINSSFNGTLIVVNRKESLFGSGWWLEGTETLMPANGNASHRLWIGGDGSARLFIPIGGGLYAPKDTVDRPEVLALTVNGSDTTWTRRLRNGATVTFDKLYRHIATTNREGHVTTFVYSSPTTYRLTAIEMPVQAATAVKYELTYDSTLGTPRLRTVRTPWTASINRDVTITTDASRRILVIKEPTADSIRFTYDGASRYVTSRVDRMGQPTLYEYAVSGYVSRVKTAYQGPSSTDTIASRVCAVEARSLATCAIDGTIAAAIPPSRYVTHLDGPRPSGGVDDRMRFFVGRFGGVDTIVDPFGATTRVTRAVTGLPALVSKVVDPLGIESHTAYNSRGLPTSTRVLKQWHASSADTTIYTWHSTWDMMTEQRSPAGEITKFGIDSLTGNRIWMQRGTHDSTRVFIDYDTTYQRPEQIYVLVASVPVVRGTYVYESTFGNLQTAITALGHRTRYFANRAGVVDSVWSTLSDTTCESGGACLRQRFIYDSARRVVRDSTFAPARNWSVNPDAPLTGSVPAMTAVVTSTYDKEGRPLTVTRRTPGMDYSSATAVSTYAYDNLGRQRLARTAGSANDSTFYDLASNPVRLVNRNRQVITQTFDALGRMTSRTTPEVRYAKSVCTVCQGAQINPDSVRIPYFQTRLTPDFTSPDIVIPTETAVFGYDLAGRMTQADNALVRIRRSYFPNGALKADTSVMRAYLPASGTSGFSGAHRYVLQYAYDSVGRRTSRTEGWGAQQTYTYDALGQLTATRDTVHESLAVTANFTYDRLGRLRTQTVPGTSFSEVWTYDAEDRSIERSGSMGETVVYDIRGKRMRVDGVLQYGGGNEITMTAAYDGFGHLVATGTTGDAIHTSDEFTVDAFGNAIKQFRNRGQAMSVPEGAEAKTFADGRLSSSTGIPYPDDPEREGPLGGPPVQAYDDLALAYDFAGNVKYQTSLHYAWDTVSTFELATGNFKFTWSFFDANGKPRYLQVRSRGDTTAATTDYNEYWYDALGRRVLAREYSDSTSGGGSLTRFAWDGDQLLREMRTPAGPYATSFEGTGSGAWAGTRRYTQSGAIDTPLILWVNNAPRVVVRNWRGSAAGGIIVASNTADTLVYPAATYDVQLAPDALLLPTPPNAWMGSLISLQADASGLLYRRNRYYDPATGRFTQEDPIGLSGGMNLYGYANGDPISGSDPFGLRVCFKGRKSEVRRMRRQIEFATNTDIAVDPMDDCVTSVDPKGREFTASGAGFNTLHGLSNVITIQFRRGRTEQVGLDVYINKWEPNYPHIYESPGRCQSSNRARPDPASMIIHELGHIYRNYLESTSSHDGSDVALAWENQVHARRRRPERDARCHTHATP